jgi:hypothetical protein
MKKRRALIVMFLVSTFLIGAASLAVGQVMRAPAPTRTLNTLPVVQPALIKTTFTSMVPSPLSLVAGMAANFTITGTALGSVTSLALVNSRTPLWRLPANILSRTGTTAIMARVSVPKYLAPGEYQIQAVTSTGVTNTGLIAQAGETKPSLVWTEFHPELHGYKFVNDKDLWGDVCFTIVGGRAEYSPGGPFCRGDWGLCGGMSLSAGERFRSGVPGTHDLEPNAAKPDAVNAQFRTLDGPTVAKFFQWMYSPDVGSTLNPYHSVGIRMQDDWNGLIKPQLDAHKPVVLGLIFDKMATLFSQLDPTNFVDVFKQHQVLGIGYTRIGASTVRIIAYDPNIPDEILILTFTTPHTGVTQALDSGNPLPSTRRPVRGVMFVRSVP